MPSKPSVQMSKAELIAALYMLRDDMTYFEWGAGQSTILFSQFVKKCISVEDSKQWAEQVQRALVTDNVKIIVESNLDNDDYINRYIEAIHRVQVPCQLVLVDGMERVRCAYAAHEKLVHSNGILLVHDWDRTEYHVIKSDYEEVNVIGTLGVLKPK